MPTTGRWRRADRWASTSSSPTDAHHARAAAHEGVEILVPPTDQEYGSRDYMARDAEGNIWSFGTYGPELPA